MRETHPRRSPSRFSGMPAILLLPVFLLAGCGGDPGKPQTFKFMVLSDTHIDGGGAKAGQIDKVRHLQEMVGKINAGEYPGVEFVIITGDLTSVLFGDSDDNRLTKACDILKKLTVPYYPAMGNHDHRMDGSVDSNGAFTQQQIDEAEGIWKQYTGFDLDYSFTRHGWKMIVLNSMHGKASNTNFDQAQMAWLEAELAGKEPTVLFFHFPLATDAMLKLWGIPGSYEFIEKNDSAALYRILDGHKDHIKGIFVGHGHIWEQDVLYKTIKVWETASLSAGGRDTASFPHRIVTAGADGSIEATRDTK